MKQRLNIISVLLLLYSLPCFPQIDTIHELTSVDSIIVKEYSMLVNIRGHEVSGICVINISPDSCIIGTIINEFGIKAFDFSYSKGKVKIFNIMSPIDKWYIRKIVKNDFSFLLSNILINYVTLSNKKRTLKKMSDGRILLENNRHKIIYTFLPLTENNETLK